ncbi:sulfite exporter TauE/SafE family protein [Bifidobacterium amazonense]|uniref:Sulfite exporter TauE/SafE family protein n=1 Tax=Bifidobacterium amazonense TaxID=2809027 RepID=A0ABS9VTG6_9BIFI|nr:sulfite exporter TauE/SafE family protein [Bifidobacterium amazonense]MCH9275393.1 sulfite exporter TauE/SafE family protein [Bifidobacterium amazonense]
MRNTTNATNTTNVRDAGKRTGRRNRRHIAVPISGVSAIRGRFRRSISKRLLWDWRTRVLLACASIPAVIETTYLIGVGDVGDTAVLFALLAIVGCLLMALLPRVGGWAVVALWAARCITPETTPFSLLFCLLMAVTIMAYLGIGMALLAVVAAQIAATSRMWLYPWDSSVFVIVCATAALSMVSLWLGSMMGWRERQEIEDQERAELLHRIADQQLATQLHHSVANDLTTILLLTRQLHPDAVVGDEADVGDFGSRGNPRNADGPGSRDDDRDDIDGNVRTGTNHIDANADGNVDDREATITLIERTAQDSLRKVRMLIAGLDRSDGREQVRPSPTGIVDRVDRAGIHDFDYPEHPDDSEDRNDPSGVDGPECLGNPITSDDIRDTVRRCDQSQRQLTVITSDELHTIAEEYDARLHANRLDGSIIVTGERRCFCAAGRKAALFDILREVVGNMMKYADPAAGYCIAVALAPGLATLSASNGVRGRNGAAGGSAVTGAATATGTASATDADDGDLSGGTGLARCRRMAASFGGEFTAEHDDGTWTILLRLPLV